MTQSLKEKIVSVIVSQLGVEKDSVTGDANFIDDLGADSLDIVELVMAFEEEFGINIPDQESEKLQTVNSVLAFIKEKQNS